MAEDPFDKPHGFIIGGLDQATRDFQANNELLKDGLFAPGGPTEATLDKAVTKALDATAPERQRWQNAVLTRGRPDLLPETAPPSPFQQASTGPDDNRPAVKGRKMQPGSESPDRASDAGLRQMAQKPADIKPTAPKWVDRSVKSDHPQHLVLRNKAWAAAPRTDGEKAALAKLPRRVIYVNRYLRDQADAVAGKGGTGITAIIETVGQRMAAAKTAEQKAAAISQMQTQFRRVILSRLAPEKRAEVEAKLTHALKAAASCADPRAAVWKAVIGQSPAEALKKLQALDRKFQLIALGGRTTVPYIKTQFFPMAADAVEWWRSGSGVAWKVKLSHLRKFGQFTAAEKRLRGHFRTWLNGGADDTNEAHKRLQDTVVNLIRKGQGGSINVEPKWTANVLFHRGGRKDRDEDLKYASGLSSIETSGPITFTKTSGNARRGVVSFSGLVSKRWWEKYNWDKGKRTKLGRSGIVINQNEALLLQKYSNAQPFLMESRWRERISGRLIIQDGKIVKVELNWVKAATNPDYSRHSVKEVVSVD